MPVTAQETTTTSYGRLLELAREASMLGSTSQLLGWDQEVLMPKGGLDYRSRQLAQLARMHHEMVTDPQVGDLLTQCESDSDLTADPRSAEAVNVRELRWAYDRKTKLPPALVEEEARISSIGQHTWAEARRDKDFSQFQPVLEKIVDLLRRKADCYGWGEDGNRGMHWPRTTRRVAPRRMWKPSSSPCATDFSHCSAN